MEGYGGAQSACAASLPAMRPKVSERSTLVAGGSIGFERVSCVVEYVVPTGME